MATKEPTTEYERRRLENIKRNQEMIASLQIHSKLAEISASTKRPRVEKNSYKLNLQKTPKREEPVVIRRSRRIQKMLPDFEGLTDTFLESSVKLTKPNNLREIPPRVLRPVGFSEAKQGKGSDQSLIDSISELETPDSVTSSARDKERFKLGSLRLDPEFVARVVPGRIMSVKFFPTSDIEMVAVGNKYGHVGFWNLKSDGGENGDYIHLYRPHSAPVTGILIHPSDMTKIYTCCYDGLLRVANLDKQEFDLLYSTPDEDAIISLAQPHDDPNSIYFGEGKHGILSMFDTREGKTSSSWNIHERRINTIDFCSSNTKIMATSSTDGTACIWDLRKMGANTKSKALQTVAHERSVQSAYFSPSGTHLATTSYDDHIGLATGPNYEGISMLSHDNQTGRWISSFKAIWGWDDTHIFVGNMKRGVDVLSADRKKTISTLTSPEMTAIPCRFDAHPNKVGALAGATSGGQVYIWRSV